MPDHLPPLCHNGTCNHLTVVCDHTDSLIFLQQKASGMCRFSSKAASICIKIYQTVFCLINICRAYETNMTGKN